MKTYEGHGFEISADGAFRRTVAVGTMSLKAARQASADVRRTVEQMQADITAGKRPFTPEERGAFEQLSAFGSSVAGRKATVEAENEYERNMSGVSDPDAEAGRRAAAAAGIRDHNPGGFFSAGRGSGARDGRLTFSALHGDVHADTGAWQDPAEIFRVLGAGLNDHRLQAAGQGGNSDAIGGYALPVATEMMIFDGAVPASIFLPRANVQPMTTKEQEIATFDRSTDGANSTMFGLGFEFIPEGGAGASVQTASLRMIGMTAHTAAILFDCSNEQLQDAGGFESGLLRAVQAATGYGIDRFCLRGVGSGQPLGIVNQPALITVDKETGQAADTIIYENLTKMWARMPVSSMPSSFWLASPSCIPELSTLSIAIGTSGSHIPAMTSKNGAYEILTRPVIFSDLCRPVGDAGDIMLVDASQYTIGMRAGMAVERSQHVGFAKNRTTFRLLLRFDGNSGWDQPYQPEFSAPTQSPFIQLEAR